MNKNDLRDIDNRLAEKVKQLRAEQAEYASGVERGIDMAVRAVRDFMNKQAEEDALKGE